MVAYTRRNIAIVTSVGAMVVTLLLIIFFGAWAVSANSGASLEGVLSGATSGFSGGISPQSAAAQTGGASTAGTGDTVPRLATASASANGAAETWWGKAFLVACPLH